MCWLRLHKDVAATYGIKKIDGNTSPMDMLIQTLEAQGCDVDWYERLPHALDSKLTANQKAAAFIKSVGRRPGRWLQQLSQRPQVAPPDHAAVLRHHGTLPKAAFPRLQELSKQRRRRTFTPNGNAQTAPEGGARCRRSVLNETVFVRTGLCTPGFEY